MAVLILFDPPEPSALKLPLPSLTSVRAIIEGIATFDDNVRSNTYEFWMASCNYAFISHSFFKRPEQSTPLTARVSFPAEQSSSNVITGLKLGSNCSKIYQ